MKKLIAIDFLKKKKKTATVNSTSCANTLSNISPDLLNNLVYKNVRIFPLKEHFLHL